MGKERKQQQSLKPRVLGFIQEHRLLGSQRQLLVAVSGGPDSVCLLHVLAQLQEELGIRLQAAHLNHQLRGTESEADAQYVTRLAEKLGIPVTIESRDVKAYQARHHLSLEEAGREVRYTFLAEIANSLGTDRVAVGHTADDHIETLLMHLIRGTGTRGLRGLLASNQWRSGSNHLTIIRPLLQISRQETVDYCYQYQLIPRLDISNLSLSPLRNRIRHQLLPLLRSYNPQVTRALLRTAHLVSDEVAFLEQESAQMWSRVVQEHGNIIVLDKTEFLKLPPALQRHLFRMALEKLSGTLKDIETRHIEAMMAVSTKPAGKKISLPEGVTLAVDYNCYRLIQDPAALSSLPVLDAKYALKIPGETCLSGWQVNATIMKPSMTSKKGKEISTSLRLAHYQVVDQEASLTNDNLTAYFDYEKAGSELTVRSRQPGDRFQPLGMGQPKKLGRFMVDAKIPRAWRPRVPIVCSSQHILWVVGWRIDDRVKVTGNTQQILCLQFKPTPIRS